MIPITEALKIIERETFALPVETIDLADSIGRVLADEVRADLDLPPFDRSQMDGFAVRSADTEKVPVRLKIIGESIAGKGFDGTVEPGEAVRIMTGARIPGGADAVQKVEVTKEIDDSVEILEPVRESTNVVRRGAEIKKGTVVFSPGETIMEHKIAALASFGYAAVKVFQKPSVSILATGSEIVNIDEKPQKDQIRNSNSIMLKAFAGKLGLGADILPMTGDDLENLAAVIARAVGLPENYQSRLTTGTSKPEDQSESTEIKSKIQNPKSKILIITGGVSVGDYDFTKPALRALGAEIFFEKVSLKPGKPAVFAKLNDVLIFGLPGNPVSVAVTFYLFARKAALLLQSAEESDLARGFAVVSARIKGAGERDSFLPVSLATDRKGRLVIEALRFSGSSNFIAFARAEALVYVPAGKNLEAGEVAEILFL
jgi:molybdopterin biosynthesis enzyme